MFQHPKEGVFLWKAFSQSSVSSWVISEGEAVSRCRKYDGKEDEGQKNVPESWERVMVWMKGERESQSVCFTRGGVRCRWAGFSSAQRSEQCVHHQSALSRMRTAFAVTSLLVSSGPPHAKDGKDAEHFEASILDGNSWQLKARPEDSVQQAVTCFYFGVFQSTVAFETDSTGVCLCVSAWLLKNHLQVCLPASGDLNRCKSFPDYLDDDYNAEVAPAAGERSEYGEERAGGRSGRGGSSESGADARQRPAKLVQRRPARRTPTPEIWGDGRGGVVWGATCTGGGAYQRSIATLTVW